MNSSFRAASSQFFSKQQSITHQQEVCRLYRNALRLLDSWVVDRALFNEEATILRAKFNEGAQCDPESGKAKHLIRKAHELINEYVHVDRYIRPHMPSGSQFMRNPPLPLDVCYPQGIPESVKKEFANIPKELDVDMSPAAEGKMAKAGQVLVDLATKRVY
ncbi:unnamed protein product [Discosporangium mesarthrocarpum]